MAGLLSLLSSLSLVVANVLLALIIVLQLIDFDYYQVQHYY